MNLWSSKARSLCYKKLLKAETQVGQANTWWHSSSAPSHSIHNSISSPTASPHHARHANRRHETVLVLLHQTTPIPSQTQLMLACQETLHVANVPPYWLEPLPPHPPVIGEVMQTLWCNFRLGPSIILDPRPNLLGTSSRRQCFDFGHDGED